MGIIAVAVVMLESFTRRLMGTRGRSSGMMTLVVAGMIALVVAGGAGADTPITGCQEITASGEYYLTGDLDASGTDGICIYIKADDVTLDGKGHCIDGGAPGSCPELDDFPGQKATGFARPGIAVKGQENVVIKNVEVKNFCTGILLYGTSSHDEYHTVTNCIVHDNGNPSVDVNTANFHGIALYKRVCYSTITNNKVYSNAAKLNSDCDDNGAGISLRVKCNHNDVMNNEVYYNTLAGIYSKAGGEDCYNTIYGNTVYENGKTGSDAGFTGGIRFQCKSTDDNTIANNIVRDNFGPGIFIGGNDCTVSDNMVTGNKDSNSGPNCRGDGLRIDRDADGGGRNTVVTGNTFCDNDHLDISVQNPATGTTGDDNTCDTGENYKDSSATGSGICKSPCSQPQPDLTITAKSETLDDSTFKVTYTVKNAGGADAGASTTGIYAGSTQIATDSVGALSADESHTGTVTIDPFDCLCGTTVTIKVCADKDGAVDESDETNNCMENTFNCPPCAADPKLCANPEHNFGTVQPDQTETWQFDVTNCGGAGTLAWTVSDDQSWISVDPTSGTDAGTVTVTVDITGISDGTHTGTVTVASDHGTETGTISLKVNGSQPSLPPPTSAEVPTFTPIGMFAMVGLLGIAGIGVIRRR